jgi:hypothetical protein
MIQGETVYVETAGDITDHDSLNAPIYEKADLIEVSNVLVLPGQRTDLVAGNRPDAARVKYTLHFPKTWTGQLENCWIHVRGERLRVIGAPAFYTPKNTPTDWNMPVEVEIVHG